MRMFCVHYHSFYGKINEKQNITLEQQHSTQNNLLLNIDSLQIFSTKLTS